MLKRTPKDARYCYERAADFSRAAQSAADAETRAFCREQEARWLKLAQSYELSERLATFIGTRRQATFSPEAEQAVQTLQGIFTRACRALDLDGSDEVEPRKIARTLIEAAIGGESDPEALFRAALKAVSN